ncbi:MAG: hypothetical protein IPM20_08640 [Gammaproteobacteria bacterium]|nr:hypothetical protein [Gammaproteobacteria bacterium]
MRITFHSICLSMFIAAVLAGRAFAAEGAGDLDITIRMMDARQTADEFINRIELPKEFQGTVPAATSSGPSNKDTQRGTDDKRKRRDGVKNNDAGRDTGERDRTDTQADLHSTNAADQGDPPGLRDRADESRERRDNFQQSSREQQESARQNSRENWDKVRESYPPSAWPDREK